MPSISSFYKCPPKSSLTLPSVHLCNDLYLGLNSFNIFELVQHLRSHACKLLLYKRWGAVNRQDMQCFNGDDTGTRWYKYIIVHTSTLCCDSINCVQLLGDRLKTCAFFVILLLSSGSTSELVCSMDRSRPRSLVSLTILSMTHGERFHLPRGFSPVFGDGGMKAGNQMRQDHQ